MQLDVRHLAEPQQGGQVVGAEILAVPLVLVRIQPRGLDVARQRLLIVLLVEVAAGDPVGKAHERQWPIAQVRQQVR